MLLRALKISRNFSVFLAKGISETTNARVLGLKLTL